MERRPWSVDRGKEVHPPDPREPAVDDDIATAAEVRSVNTYTFKGPKGFDRGIEG